MPRLVFVKSMKSFPRQEKYELYIDGYLKPNTIIWYDFLWYDVPTSHVTYDQVNALRAELIADVIAVRSVYYTTAYKNLNLVRDKLHPDVITTLVNLINDLRVVHYLETPDEFL